MKAQSNWSLWLAALLALVMSTSLVACSDDDDDDDDDTTANDDDTTPTDDDDDDPIDIEIEEGCNPLSVTDACMLPYPTAYYQKADSTSPTRMRNNYPQDAFNRTTGGEVLNVTRLNLADGVPPIGPILLHYGVDVADEFLNRQRELPLSLEAGHDIVLFDAETGERVMFFAEMDANAQDEMRDRSAFIIRPLVPMEMGHRHIVAITTDVTDKDGNPLEVPPAFAALRDGTPTTNEIVEDLRDHYNDLFDFLEDKGYERASLALAWDFTVASKDWLLGPVLSMREQALEWLAENEINYTIETNEADPNGSTSRIVTGTYEVPNFLTENNDIVYDEDHNPVMQGTHEYPFSLTVPKMAKEADGPLPFALFGHGLFGSGRDYLVGGLGGTIQPIGEQAGASLIATDWIGLANGDLQIIVSNVVSDLNRITVITDRLQQSLINNFVLTKFAMRELNADPAFRVSEHNLIDPSQAYYFGVSLGGIQGTSLISISDEISRAMFSVPGSGWANMIPRSSNWPTIQIVFNQAFPDPLLQQIGVAFVQTFFDHSDPINFSRIFFREPLPDAPPDRLAIWAEAIYDSQVPNLTTEMLARALGIKQMEPYVFDVFGLEKVQSPTTTPCLVQYDLEELTVGNEPPDVNLPPTFDNGAHFGMNLEGNFHEQVFTALKDGQIVQFCEGSCNPD